MDQPQEFNFLDRGVRLPTGGLWVDVPGSPFQVMARDSDIMGTVYMRVSPAYAHHWSEFKAMMEQGD